MGQLTLQIQQHNGLTSITNIHLTEADAIKDIQSWLDTGRGGLSVEDAFKHGQCITVPVDEKDLKKIIKQGYLYAAFAYHVNDRGYSIPLVIKASKSGLVKEFRANHDPKATEHSLFRDCFNAAAFTLDQNNIPTGFIHVKYCGLKII